MSNLPSPARRPENMAKKLSLREVAAILKVTNQRVYQMDDELQPEYAPRGAMMCTRYYDAEVVERVRQKRNEQVVDVVAKTNSAWGILVTQASRTKYQVALTREQFPELAIASCACCGAPPSPVHGLARVDGSGPFSAENLVPCCGDCRSLKGNSDVKTLVERAWLIAQWQSRPAPLQEADEDEVESAGQEANESRPESVQ